MSDQERPGLDISFEPDSSQIDENLRLLGSLSNPEAFDEHLEYARRLHAVIDQQAELTGESHDAVRAASMAQHFEVWAEEDPDTALEKVGKLSFNLGKVAMEPVVEKLEEQNQALRIEVEDLNASNDEKEILLKDERQAREQAEYDARHDSLTGLLNLHGFNEAVRQETSHISTETDAGRRHVIVIGDLDNFKSLNDAEGHPAGDEHLKDVARRLSLAVRDDDIVGRVGGEEFALLLKDTTEEEAHVILERLRGLLNKLDRKDGMLAGMSIGMTEFMQGSHLDDAISRADRAMYFSKAHGKNRISSWEDLPGGYDGPGSQARLPANFDKPANMRDN